MITISGELFTSRKTSVVVLLCLDMDPRNNSNLLGENVILTFLLDKRDLETVKFHL
jgi:hypothetical protein